MTYRDQEPMGMTPRTDIERRTDPTMRATPRQAMWSWVAAIAIVVILGVVFYGINAADTSRTAANPPAAAVITPAPETTGQGGGAAAPSAPQSNDQGTARKDSQPKSKDAPKDKDAK